MQRVTVAIGLTITAQHGGKTRKPRSDCSMNLKGEKSSMVGLRWRSAVTPWKRGSPQIKGAATIRM